jgi:ketosteroid isomerase-like protein
MPERRELTELIYSAINRRDLDTVLAHVAEDAEFRSMVAEADGETFRGHDGVRSWWTQVVQALGGLGFDLEEYRDEGEGAVIKVRVRGLVGTTGIEQTMWQGVTFRDEKAVWWGLFRSEEEAAAAVRGRLEAGVEDHRGE